MPHMLGKSLFIILFLLLTLSLLPTQVFAAFESDILGVSLTKNEDGSYMGEVSVRMLADALNDMPYPSRLMVASEYIASGFKHTKAGEITLDCNVSAEAVLCTHLPSSSAEELVYTFVWSPSDIIQKSYCYSEAGEKQVSEGAVGKYQKKISIVTKSGYPYLRKVVINGITTSGEMRDTYADISTSGSFAVLWTLGSFASGSNIASVTFVGSGKYPQMAKGSGQSGSTFLPYAGSITHFGKNANIANNLFFVNVKKEEIGVEAAVFEFCQKENIEQSELVAVLEHAILGGEQSAASSDNLTVTWDAITYPAAPTSTPTITPTSAPTATHTPTPTTNVTNSSQNPTSTSTPTPTELEQRAESKVESNSGSPTATPTPTGQSVGNILSGGASSEGLASATARNADGERDILGETTSRPKTNPTGVISTPTGDESVGWRDLLFDRHAFITFFAIVLFFVTTVLICSFLYKKTHASNMIRDLSTRSLRSRSRDDAKSRNLPKLLAYIKKLIGIFIIPLCVIMFARPAAAQTATSYKITDAFTMQGTGTYTGVMNLKYVYATKVSTPGRYVISNKPDGTGSIQIGNYLSVWVQHTYWHSMQSQWVGPADNTYSAHFKCPSQTTLEPQNVSSWFHSTGTYALTFRFITSCYQSFPVSDMYLVFLPDPTPTPTATPTSTPTPTVAPFLDLPWDYKSKDLTFSQAATLMTSYFDHEYPTLSINELHDVPNSMIVYISSAKNFRSDYTSHDGYDYGNISKAHYGDPQLAAASGIATFHNGFWQQGNAIYIDHKNSFQTRYYHLDPDGLITNEAGKEIDVKQGQIIGKIGYTGNVKPKNKEGAHIHFMVIYDKNHDGDFDDNIPDGLIDPYGWEGEEGKDPWENFTFSYSGKTMTGMKSRYLWKYDLLTSKLLIDQNKKSGLIDGEGFDINIDDLVIGDQESLEFITRIVPADVKSSGDNDVEKLGVVIDLVIKDENGDNVRYLRNPFNLIIDLLRPDIKNSIKPESVKIMSSSDYGITWQDEITVIDWENKKAMAYIDHATLFAVVGEKKDTTPPETTISASGLGKGTNYRSDVTIDIQALDKDPDTLGIEYTLYTLDSEYEWQEYLSPLTVASSGAHFVKAFSADKSGNVESAKRVDFTIDKKVPEISIRHATSSAGFVFSGLEESVMLRQAQYDTGNEVVAAEDEAGNIHELNYKVTEEGGMHTLHITNGSKNGVAIDYQSSTYAITSDNTHEYLQSGDKIIRIIQGSNGEMHIIDVDDIRIYTGQRPLQLVTSDGRLKIDD